MREQTTCCVVGGGPAGMVLGLLLARAGVAVTVLEKHGDFLRDFRGDTVHPSTLTLLDELGLAGKFAGLPHSRLHRITFSVGKKSEPLVIDLGRLNVPHPYVAMVPQWELLTLLAEAGKAEPTFTLQMDTQVTGVLREMGSVAGVRYRRADGTTGEVRADLTVACDGRSSVLRREANLPLNEFPVPLDAWSFRMPREEAQDLQALSPHVADGQVVVIVPREGYYQMVYLARKGSDAELRAEGVERFRQRVAALVPQLAEHVGAIESMDDVRFLEVRMNMMRRWYTDGLLCIGDAAHAMSPVAGVGINLAVQDAVATARVAAGPLLRGTLDVRELARIQRRRRLPAVLAQGFQRALHTAVVRPALQGRDQGPPKPVLALIRRIPALTHLPAYLIGVGFRPEHAPPFARR